MHLSTAFFISMITASAAAQSLNTSAEYHLQTQLKPGQDDKKRFDDLWLVASHTGAGMNDAVLYKNQSYAIKGFMNATNAPAPYFHQLFDLGGSFSWDMVVADVNFYAAWEPVRINAGSGSPEFYLNSSGLQWNQNPSSTQNSFGGWLVCDWWHGVPQLFAKWSYYAYENPSSCADVNLLPVYI